MSKKGKNKVCVCVCVCVQCLMCHEAENIEITPAAEYKKPLQEQYKWLACVQCPKEHAEYHVWKWQKWESHQQVLYADCGQSVQSGLSVYEL